MAGGKSLNLRQAANGESCVACGADDGTVVLAHRNVPGHFGTGLKGPDIWGAHLCYACHEESEQSHRKDPGWWEPKILKTQLRLLASGRLKIQ